MNKETQENFQVAEEILKNLKIPGKKDSMLKAAKFKHIEVVGKLLNNTLITTSLSQSEINTIVMDFQEKYRDTFLKFITKEG